MSVYYKCLSGDSEHLAVAEPFSFGVLDAKGRNWICHPICQADLENLDLRQHLADVRETDARADRHGLRQRGTEVRICYCHSAAELREKLADDPPPTATGT